MSLFWNGLHTKNPIGLIAGQGDFPVLFAEAASSVKREFILIGLQGYTDKRVETFAREVHYIGLGSLQSLLDLLKEKRIKQVVLAGSVPKREIYYPNLELDSTAKSFMSSSGEKGDDHLLRAFQLFLKARCGVSVMDSRQFLKGALAKKGVMTKRQPTKEEWADLKFGWRAAKGIGKLDIGQTVVVKKGVVLAVEALEGTDNAIQRGGTLGNGEVVVVKVSKPTQNLRFDLPCVGPKTLESLKATRSKVLGVEAGKTIMINKDAVIDLANREGITLVGL